MNTARLWAWMLAIVLAMLFGYCLGWEAGDRHATDKMMKHDLPVFHYLKDKRWAH